MTPAEFERFRKKVDVDPNGCWLWTAAKVWDGYGNFAVGGKTGRAHRLSYELFIGPIPKGLVIDHLCRTPLCVNPSHMEPVTIRENILRGQTRPAANRAKTHCREGHPLAGDNLYVAPGSPTHRDCRTCRIKRAKAWHQANDRASTP